MEQLILDAVELSLIPGLGTQSLNRLQAAFPPGRELWGLSTPELLAGGAAPEAATAIRSRRFRGLAEEIVSTGVRQGWHFLVRSGGRYPRLLAEIFDPPFVVYARGRIEALEVPAVALVGTRRPTYYGLQVSQGLATDLGRVGIAIVSGLARGIDAAAHRGCLEAKAVTLAVLGCGVDIVYPREHAKLSEQIMERGLLLSEFPPGTPPAPQNFPVRNRIISGLSLGVIIVEASEYSGSLITARVAMEQNREVFAVPGNVTSPRSFGPNYLIKQGAKLVQCWRDVVEELPAEVRHPVLAREAVLPRGTPELEMLSSEESLVLGILQSDEATQFDAVLQRSRLPIPQLSNILFHLEIRGWIRQVPGNLYVKAVRPQK
jgi:DNA processing protein